MDYQKKYLKYKKKYLNLINEFKQKGGFNDYDEKRLKILEDRGVKEGDYEWTEYNRLRHLKAEHERSVKKREKAYLEQRQLQRHKEAQERLRQSRKEKQSSIDEIRKRIGQLQGRSLEERRVELDRLQREVDYTYKRLEEAVANHDKAKEKLNQEILVQGLEDTLKKETAVNPEAKRELEELYKKLEDLQ